MANPVLLAIAADTWVKVATDVISGFIHIKKTTPANYFVTYRDTGNPGPSVLNEAVLLPWGDVGVISASAGIDVYVYCTGAAGRVRVDL